MTDEVFLLNVTANKSLTHNAQKLRKEMTDEEKHLWYDFLKNLPVSFNRQKVIGKYIVDFYCAKSKLVIEIDGSQHYEDEGLEKDKQRDKYLQSLGLTVIRYTNLDINLRFEDVCRDIYKMLKI